MEAFGYRSSIVALATTSILFLGLSMQQPWFTIQDSYTLNYDGITNAYEDSIRIYPKYYTFTTGNSKLTTGYPYGVNEVEWFAGTFFHESRILQVMGSVNNDLLICIGLVWLLTMAALLNSRLMTFLFAWITAVASLLCVVVFSGRIPQAVRDSSESLQHWPTYHVTGLFGKETVYLGGYYSRTDSWSWQPSWGWFFALLAVALLCVVVLLTFLSARLRVSEYRAEMEAINDAQTETTPILDTTPDESNDFSKT